MLGVQVTPVNQPVKEKETQGKGDAGKPNVVMITEPLLYVPSKARKADAGGPLTFE